MVKKNSFVISRVPNGLREQFLEAVAKNDKTVSEVIRTMIENYVKHNG